MIPKLLEFLKTTLPRLASPQKYYRRLIRISCLSIKTVIQLPVLPELGANADFTRVLTRRHSIPLSGFLLTQ